MPVRVLRNVPDAEVDQVVADFRSEGCDPVTKEREPDGNGWKVTAECPGAGERGSGDSTDDSSDDESTDLSKETFLAALREELPDIADEADSIGNSLDDLAALASVEDLEEGRPFDLDLPVTAGFCIALWETARRLRPKLRRAADAALQLVERLDIAAEFTATVDQQTRERQISASLRTPILTMGFQHIDKVTQVIFKCGTSSRRSP